MHVHTDDITDDNISILALGTVAELKFRALLSMS
jgi:hypothetical protein